MAPIVKQHKLCVCSLQIKLMDASAGLSPDMSIIPRRQDLIWTALLSHTMAHEYTVALAKLAEYRHDSFGSGPVELQVSRAVAVRNGGVGV